MFQPGNLIPQSCRFYIAVLQITSGDSLDQWSPLLMVKTGQTAREELAKFTWIPRQNDGEPSAVHNSRMQLNVQRLEHLKTVFISLVRSKSFLLSSINGGECKWLMQGIIPSLNSDN